MLFLINAVSNRAATWLLYSPFFCLLPPAFCLLVKALLSTLHLQERFQVWERAGMCDGWHVIALQVNRVVSE